MVQLGVLEDGVEVNGQTVLAFIDGVPSTFEDKAEYILERNGIENPKPDSWHPQQAWLDAFAEMAENIGENTLKNIGKSIPENADWPPGVTSVTEAIESIDDAYHMNHRNGEIGHYHAEAVDDEEVRVRCTNPYPCAFDEGIITATSSKFSDGYVGIEESGSECRSEGGDECVYKVTW
jgi:predicted hydrocarbon binding protein